MKKLKFNLAVSVTLLIVFTLLLVGTTIAYFSDTAVTPTNTFTAGNVSIVLSEAAVKSDAVGNLVEDTTRPRITGDDLAVHNYGRIYPSQTIYKDPTVENTGSEDAYIAIKLSVFDGAGDLTKLIGYDGDDGIDIRELLSGGSLSEGMHFGNWNGFSGVTYNENYAMLQFPNAAENRFDFYFFYEKPLKNDNSSITLFDTMKIPDFWGNVEMRELADLRIDIEAYAVQTFNLGSCYEAMKAAFPERFNF